MIGAPPSPILAHVALRVAIVGGGLAGLEAAVVLARRPDVHVEVIERGPSLRRHHIQWDKRTLPGDEKIGRWTSDGWGHGGGLSERLGGRSLCYNGVLVPFEPKTLEDWPSAWASRLSGLYESIYADLESAFPELPRRPLGDAATELGLRHAPQCVRFEPHTRRLASYTPLTKALELADEGDRLSIVRAAGRRVRTDSAGRITVDVANENGAPSARGGFDACVLAASAIGNVQVLAESLGDELSVPLTDHFSVGVVARLERGDSLGPFEHHEIWTGFREIPDLSANAFLVELAPLPEGDRIIELLAVIEQGDTAADFSTLTVSPNGSPTGPASHIETKISNADYRRLSDVRAYLTAFVQRLAQTPLRDVTHDHPVPHPTFDSAHTVPDPPQARWFGRERAFRAVHNQSEPGCFAHFDFPYGSFEHEACCHPMSTGSLVAESLEVDALPKVYVAGPGTFPRMGPENPALTILAISRWLGATLPDGA